MPVSENATQLPQFRITIDDFRLCLHSLRYSIILTNRSPHLGILSSKRVLWSWHGLLDKRCRVRPKQFWGVLSISASMELRNGSSTTGRIPSSTTRSSSRSSAPSGMCTHLDRFDHSGFRSHPSIIFSKNNDLDLSCIIVHVRRNLMVGRWTFSAENFECLSTESGVHIMGNTSRYLFSQQLEMRNNQPTALVAALYAKNTSRHVNNLRWGHCCAWRPSHKSSGLQHEVNFLDVSTYTALI